MRLVCLCPGAFSKSMSSDSVPHTPFEYLTLSAFLSLLHLFLVQKEVTNMKRPSFLCSQAFFPCLCSVITDQCWQWLMQGKHCWNSWMTWALLHSGFSLSPQLQGNAPPPSFLLRPPSEHTHITSHTTSLEKNKQSLRHAHLLSLF